MMSFYNKTDFPSCKQTSPQSKIHLLLSEICIVESQSANSRIGQRKAQIFSAHKASKNLQKQGRHV